MEFKRRVRESFWLRANGSELRADLSVLSKFCGQATKGAWGMSWRQKTMTGVEDCEKSGVVVKQTLIPEYPNQPALNP